jgi:hypothetical protein
MHTPPDTSAERRLLELTRAVDGMRAASVASAGRRSADADAAIVVSSVAYVADAAGPAVTVRVGTSGVLAVTLSARLVSTAPRVLYGCRIVGPYVDEALTEPLDTSADGPEEPPAPATAQNIVEPADRAALATGPGDVNASLVREYTGLPAGWYRVEARYRVTSATGTVQYRQLVAAPR